MENPFGMIRSFFVDGIFGNVIRFIFDRFFGGVFTNNINFSNIIDLKNCHFKDLTIDAEKINQKLFKNSPFKLFSGRIGSFSIKFPSLNALLTESLEVRLDKLDILLVMNDVDFSKAEQEISSQLGKVNINDNPQDGDEESNMGAGSAQEFDIYKKIINRILFNMKLKVKNICLRVVSEKPYKKVRLPIAPCFMLKVAKIEVKKNFDQNATSEANKDNMMFNKNQNYDIHIYGITAHMMVNYELKPDEYIGKVNDPKAEFPFTYPNESHPSTFFICACRKLKKKSETDLNATVNQESFEPISIHINFSNDKSKSVDVNIPNIEIMFDFLKIKYLSRYVDKLMEWKKYLDYKKALQEQNTSTKKSPNIGPQDTPSFQNQQRKGSLDMFPLDSAPKTHRKGLSEMNRLATFGNQDNMMPGTPPTTTANNTTTEKNKKIRIAGYDIDLNYFQKSYPPEGGASDKAIKDLNVNLEGLSELVSEPFELTTGDILDTSNVHVNLNLKSIYIYLLKSCSAFLEIEFRRRWLFGGDPQTDLHRSFNKKIPINYFQLKCTKMNLSMHTKEGLTSLTFSSFKILDITRIETPVKIKSSNNNSSFCNPVMNKSQVPWNKSEMFHSFLMDKSMMGSGFKFPELKRNVSNDPNESMLFQSARSDVTKDFLTMREVRKQIIDWDIDSKREHFCVNVVFKFNKGSNGIPKDKKGSESFKTMKYLEDSIIHCPLNTDPLIKEVPSAQSKPTIRFQTKGAKIVASLEFPPMYVNFYMGIVHDINFLLHNASDSYKIGENWYLEQNQNLIRKWEQELREASKGENSSKEPAPKRRDLEAKEKEKIDEILEAYYKRQNQLLSLDVSFIVPFVKIAFNLENTKKEPHSCFCGFSSHYFADSMVYHPVFKKDFIIIELSQLIFKVLKVPSNELFYAQNTVEARKLTALQTHVLFQTLDIYLPSKKIDENKVLMVKLLSIHPTQQEGKIIVPSITLTIYEEDTSVYLSGKETLRDQEERKTDYSNKNGRKGSDKDKKSAPWAEKSSYDNNRESGPQEGFYNSRFKRHMNKNISPDLEYLKLLGEESIGSLKVTIPKFEVFASKQSLEFLRSFSKDGLSLIEDLNAKLAQIIDQERRLFTSVLETAKPNKTPPIANLFMYIEELSIELFQDEKVDQSFDQLLVTKNKFRGNLQNLGESVLDASFSAPAWERSYAANSQVSEMRCYYPEEEFKKALESALKVIFRQNEAIVYRNPRDLVDIVHLEIHDLLFIDKHQEKPYFGSFQTVSTEASRELNREYLDEEKQYVAQECIVYKQSCWNTWSKPLSAYRVLKEPESFSELKNKGIYILENNHRPFEYKNKNVISMGLLKYIKEERQRIEIEARIGFLVLRSDLKVGFVDVLKDIASSFKSGGGEKKEEGNEHFNSMYSVEKREAHEDVNISIQCSVENILIDINPYMNYDYCKTFGKVNYGIDPDSLIYEQKDLLFYSDTRSLIGLESLVLRINKKGNRVQFDSFEVASLDFLMRQQKPDPSLKENRIILRSKEDSFFEREFEELSVIYGFKSHPLYISGLLLTSPGEDLKKLDLKLSKVELNLYADTFPTIEKHLHLILCVIEKRKYTGDEEQNVGIEEQKESDKEINTGLKQEQANKPKDFIVTAEDIEIDKDFFMPVDIIHKSKQMINGGNKSDVPKDDDFDDVEEIDDDFHSFDGDEVNKSYETVHSMPSVSTSFVSSSTVFYFDEDNLHEFSIENQILSKKICCKVDEINIKIFESYEFDNDPLVMEIPVPQDENEEEKEKEMQTILLTQDRQRFEKLPKGISYSEKAECIMVVLENFKLGLMFFGKNENLRTNLTWRASVTLENFEILDCFKNSKKKSEINVKLLTKFRPTSPDVSKPTPLNVTEYKKENAIAISNTFDAIFECFEHNKCQQKDIRAFVAIHPIEVYFGTPHYNFSKLFLAKMSLKSRDSQLKRGNSEETFIHKDSVDYRQFERQNAKSDIFVSFFYMAPLEVKMNLNLDISIINLDLFKNLHLSFPNLVIRGAENTNDLKKEAIDFYVKRVKKQLGKFIKDLPILRNIKNLSSATLNIFYSPYLNYRENGGLLFGLKDGFFGFVSSVSNESVNLVSFVTTMVDNMTNLSGIRGRMSGQERQNNQ